MHDDHAKTVARKWAPWAVVALAAAATLVLAAGARATGHSGPYGTMSTVPHTPRPMLGTFHGTGGAKPAAPQPGAVAPETAPLLQDQTGQAPPLGGAAPPALGAPQGQAPQEQAPQEQAPQQQAPITITVPEEK